jgi:hypothetical protein
VRRAILKALEEEGRKSGLKQTDIACAIGVHRSVINRELRGKKDLTLGRVAELAWAMGRIPFFDLPERKLPAGSNLPQPTTTHVPAANVTPTITASSNFDPSMAYLKMTRATPVILPTVKP